MLRNKSFMLVYSFACTHDCDLSKYMLEQFSRFQKTVPRTHSQRINLTCQYTFGGVACGTFPANNLFWSSKNETFPIQPTFHDPNCNVCLGLGNI